MHEAIRQARRNLLYPFGTVISNSTTGEILAHGVNTSSRHPMFHGEVVAINDYVAQYGNHGWADTTLYTTGEPCPMCMSAIAWAGIGGVVWASSIHIIRQSGIPQIDLGAREVATRATSFYRPSVFVGGVLAGLTDQMFLSRRPNKTQ
ncbi:nucleoside deaminase [Burkholderia sp. MS455]|nr:nucleoside deaminase [Burkholderia sp. MS455]